MIRKLFSRSCVCLLVAVIAFISGCGETHKVNTLKFAHSLDTSHPVHKAMEFLDQRLRVLSDGKMRIEIYPSGQLGSEREAIELLQIGGLAMTKVSASPLEAFIPEMKVLSLPYIFKNSDHCWEILNGPIGRQLLESGEEYRIRGLAYYDAGSRSFYSTEKPVNSPEDLAGMKIRVMNSQTAVSMVKELGGSPTPVSFGELYTSLQQGVVDGAENNPPSYYLSKHYEVAKYYTIDEHTSIPDVVLISTYVWNNLNEQEKSWLQQATDESVDYQRKLWGKSTKEALEAVKAAGVQVVTPNKALFEAKVSGIYDSDELAPYRDLIEKIRRQGE